MNNLILIVFMLLLCPLCLRADIFDFDKGRMGKETLRAYAGRAVSCLPLLQTEDEVFREDLRMLTNIGAKYIGRAATYSWSGNMSLAAIEAHYKQVAERAKICHEADPQMLLQAGVFEIIYRDTANNTPIPAYVFEAFGKKPEDRHFDYDSMIKTYGPDAADRRPWGNDASAVPDIRKTETQMYFYWQITRYIDAGIEAFHLGQAEKMAGYDSRNYKYWDKVTALARKYAKQHARRGLALFDCHTAITSGGMKIGDRHICDLIGAGIVPDETEYKDGAYMCRICDYRDCWLQWIGRSDGGLHPLGFRVEDNFTILEFDNYGGNGKPFAPTFQAFYNWGFDDITWFALQPSWYRDQFLMECDIYLKNHNLDSEGRQQYFLQAPCRRLVTEKTTLTYTVKDPARKAEVTRLAELERASCRWEGDTVTITGSHDYRCNTPSDRCPNGFGQEEVIKRIFAGENNRRP
ncbi:MAG: hypothetical protein IK083_06535 [Abditibacteriota bacterium]|nr:hypothetical protein [Abditibacteriota bacterium]